MTEQKRYSLASASTLALGFVMAGLALAAPARAEAPAERDPTAVDEVVVTATKREERLQDVPLSVRALTAADLERLNAQDLAGYVNTIPGVSFEDRGVGRSEINIRGINSLGSPGSVEPVGYYIDDVAQTDEEQSDLELYDLRDVEILRGPQGTLYGEGSLGGTVKIATRAPNLSRFDYGFEAETSGVEGGDRGYAVRGMLNVPLAEDKAGLRLVAWDRDRPGWIDNVVLGRSNDNDAQTRGARLALVIKPSDRLTLTFRALTQELHAGAPSQRNPALGSDKVDIATPQHTDQDFNQISAALAYDLGFADLSSIVARYHRDQNANNFLAAFGGLNVVADQPVDIVSNETRLTSKVTESFDWIAGLYLMKREDGVNQYAYFAGGGPLFFSAKGGATRKQTAVYGEMNWRPTRALQLTVGGRLFKETNHFTNLQEIPFLGFPPELIDKKTSDQAFTPKFSARYRFTDDIQLYGVVSRGFRSGGNTYLSSVAGVPDHFGPDYAWNYEAGLKTAWMDGKLTANLAVYRMNWTKIQVLAEAALLPGFVTTQNAGAAHSQGLEFEVLARPQPGLTVSFGYGLIDTAFDDPAPSLGIVPGDKIPGVAKSSLALGVDYRFPLGGAYEGFLGANGRWVGRSLGAYSTDGSRPDPLKGYALVGAQAGVEHGPWSLRVFVDNLFNEEVVTGFEDFNGTDRLDYVNRPRQVGVRLSLTR